MTDRDVLTRALDALRAGRVGTLATVVGVEGSAYQREGARLFVGEDGQITGLISGGCLEGEVALEAEQASADHRPRVLRYDTADESIFGYGMGCPGIVHVLLEPLPQGDAAAAYITWLEAVLAGDGTVRAVALDAARGGELRQVMWMEGDTVGTLGDLELDAAVKSRAAALAAKPAASAAERLGPLSSQVYIDVSPERPRLVIFGAGDDAQPLARFGHGVGMQVHVVDPRPAMASAARFPEADIISVLQPEQYKTVPLGRASHVVVMGHQMERDEAALAHALSSEATYVGLLSSRGRRERLLVGLQSRGGMPEGAQSRLFAPIGLDIGAKGPEEIAISILAEIVARRHGRGGASLSSR
jgi:xanthine dehydrogenase accessory factor